MLLSATHDWERPYPLHNQTHLLNIHADNANVGIVRSFRLHMSYGADIPHRQLCCRSPSTLLRLRHARWLPRLQAAAAAATVESASRLPPASTQVGIYAFVSSVAKQYAWTRQSIQLSWLKQLNS